MAKSWGARIVGRLFGSRSNKKFYAEGNETTNLENPAKDSEEGPDQFELGASDEAAPTKRTSKAQLNVGKPDELEIPTLPVEPAKENADESATPLSNFEPNQKSSQVRITKSQSGRLADTASREGEATVTSETSEGQSVVGNGRPKQKPDRGTQRKTANKVSTNVEPENRAQELVLAKGTVAAQNPSSDLGLRNVGQGGEKNATVPIAPTSPLKLSRKQKRSAVDEQVTDKELSELEAENARLKLLLSQKLKSEGSS